MRIAHVVTLLCAASFSAIAAGCFFNNGESPEGTAAPVEFAVEYLAACRNGDSARVSAMLTSHADVEIARMYGSVGKYVAEAKKNLSPMGECRPGETSPYTRPGDDGKWVEFTCGASTFGVYVVTGANAQLQVDTVLTQSPFDTATCAPAFGFALSVPQGAFLTYYWGAIMGRHPMEVRKEGAAKLTDDQRLEYLQQCTTDEFRAEMLADEQCGGDLLKFLNFCRDTMDDFSNPRVEESVGDEGSCRAWLKRLEGPGTLEITSYCRREHGQYRLVRTKSRE